MSLMERLTAMSITYMEGQIQAGVNAIQIFDSWIGALSMEQYENGVFPYMKHIIGTIKERYPHIPITMFGVGTKHLFPVWKELPLDVIGCDWRCSIAEASAMGIKQTLQGNLDPAYLFADWKTIQGEIDRILAEGAAHGKHIFNLGHGVVPDANPKVLRNIVEYVHDRG